MSAEVWGVDYEYKTRATVFVQADTKKEAEKEVERIWKTTRPHRIHTALTDETDFTIIHTEKELLP